MTKGQFDSPNDNGGIKSLLIANRGEIAVRIARTAAEMGIVTTAIYSQDDQTSLHVKRANKAIELPGNGARAYLDMDAVIQAAISCGATSFPELTARRI